MEVWRLKELKSALYLIVYTFPGLYLKIWPGSHQVLKCLQSINLSNLHLINSVSLSFPLSIHTVHA